MLLNCERLINRLSLTCFPLPVSYLFCLTCFLECCGFLGVVFLQAFFS